MTTEQEQSLRDAFLSAQIAPPSHFEATGNIIRYPGNPNKPQRKNEWYVLYDGELACCVFGSWSDGKSHKWLSRDLSTFSESDKRTWKHRQDAARRKRDAARDKLYAEQRPVFTEIMAQAHRTDIEQFPYCLAKKIVPTGAYLSEYQGVTSLVIPRYKDDALVGIQKITADGSKKYMYGSQAAGSYLMLSGSNQRNAILLCEGWATACTLHEATGCHVVVAFDCGNLLPVAKSIVTDYPLNKLIICADDDHATEGNPGITKATEAARAVSCLMLTPEFLDLDGNTDFNDMAHEQGITAVASYIGNQVELIPKPPLFLDGNDLVASPLNVRYLISKVIERDTLVEIFGPPGSGKSFVALDIALSIATGTPWAGNKVHQGKVVYFAGEGFGGLSRRVKAWYFNNPCDLSHFHLSRTTIQFNDSGLSSAEAEINMLEQATSTTVAMIVIDTLARHMMGDENSTKDMSEFVQTLDKFRLAFPDAVVVVVHHTGHSSGERGRGSSALKGAVEAEIMCDGGALTWTKMKDGDLPAPLPFKLNKICLGVDEDGLDINSCWLSYGEMDEEKLLKSLSDDEQNAFDALQAASIKHPVERDGFHSATIESWKNEFIIIKQRLNSEIKMESINRIFRRINNSNKLKSIIAKDGLHACLFSSATQQFIREKL